MTREWQPGDVANVSAPGLDERRATWATDCPKENHPAAPHWHIATRNTYLPANTYGLVARPLVVIDPEDREQIERLYSLYEGAPLGAIDSMQAALREYADPPSPRPDEPLLLGAVIEDEGALWVGLGTDPGELNWCSAKGHWNYWDEFASPRVLSPGYDPEATT